MIRYVSILLVLFGLFAIPASVTSQDNSDQPDKAIAPITTFAVVAIKIVDGPQQNTIILTEEGDIHCRRITVIDNADEHRKTTIEIHTKATDVELKAVVDVFAQVHMETLPQPNQETANHPKYIVLQATDTNRVMVYVAPINDYGNFKERVEPLIKALTAINDRIK